MHCAWLSGFVLAMEAPPPQAPVPAPLPSPEASLAVVAERVIAKARIALDAVGSSTAASTAAYLESAWNSIVTGEDVRVIAGTARTEGRPLRVPVRLPYGPAVSVGTPAALEWRSHPRTAARLSKVGSGESLPLSLPRPDEGWTRVEGLPALSSGEWTLCLDRSSGRSLGCVGFSVVEDAPPSHCPQGLDTAEREVCTLIDLWGSGRTFEIEALVPSLSTHQARETLVLIHRQGRWGRRPDP